MSKYYVDAIDTYKIPIEYTINPRKTLSAMVNSSNIEISDRFDGKEIIQNNSKLYSVHYKKFNTDEIYHCKRKDLQKVAGINDNYILVEDNLKILFDSLPERDTIYYRIVPCIEEFFKCSTQIDIMAEIITNDNVFREDINSNYPISVKSEYADKFCKIDPKLKTSMDIDLVQEYYPKLSPMFITSLDNINNGGNLYIYELTESKLNDLVNKNIQLIAPKFRKNPYEIIIIPSLYPLYQIQLDSFVQRLNIDAYAFSVINQ